MLNGNNEKQLNRIINTDPARRRLFFGVFVLFGFAFVVSFVTNPDKQETCDSNFNSTDTSLSFHPESYDSIDIYQLTHNNWWQLNSIISLLRCRSSRTRAHAIVNDKWILVSVPGFSFFFHQLNSINYKKEAFKRDEMDVMCRLECFWIDIVEHWVQVWYAEEQWNDFWGSFLFGLIEILQVFIVELKMA